MSLFHLLACFPWKGKMTNKFSCVKKCALKAGQKCLFSYYTKLYFILTNACFNIVSLIVPKIFVMTHYSACNCRYCGYLCLMDAHNATLLQNKSLIYSAYLERRKRQGNTEGIIYNTTQAVQMLSAGHLQKFSTHQ